jgi:RNA recognition motif-containing protein
MQQDLDLRVPIEAPRLDAIHNGGHRNGDPAPRRPGREGASTRPADRSERLPRHATNNDDSVYVSNLPWDATSDDVRELFGRYGKVHETTIITDRRTGRSKGFGFVDMSRPEAECAIEALHGSMLNGRDLTVRFARPRQYNG